MLTFAGGGWVILAAAIVTGLLLAWAIAPALLVERPPGDGRTVESYAFDLSPLLVPRETVVPVMRRRDMVPVLGPGEARFITAAEVARINQEERGKFLVSTDRVAGVRINGEARAYPLNMLTVHEVVHDEVGGVPIAVTYGWLTDSVRVLDRRADGDVLTIGVSGLVSNGNTLLYDRAAAADEDEPAVGGESLWLQLTGRAMSGSAAERGLRLRTIPAQVVSWSHWLAEEPETTVLARDAQFIRRYRGAVPDEYFRSAEIPVPVDPLPDDDEPGAKDRVIVLIAGDEQRAYPLSLIRRRALDGSDEDAGFWRWSDSFAGGEVRFRYDPRSDTALVRADGSLDIAHCLWFAWHAPFPRTPIARDETADARR